MSVAAEKEPAPAATSTNEESQQQEAATTGEDVPNNIMPEMLCGECEKVLASVYCNACHEQYCRSCTLSVHSKGRRKMHTDLTRLFVCGECDVVFATVECSQCQETFCEPCCKAVHSKGQRKEKIHLHKFLPLEGRNHSVTNHEQSNAFGILRSELQFQRFTGLGALAEGLIDADTAAAIKEREECDLRVQMLRVDESQAQDLFRDTLCTLSPDQPVPVHLVSTGTDEESVSRVAEQRLRRLDSFNARSTLFGDEIKEFSCWRRVHDVSQGEGALFCHRAHPTHHEYPESLLRMPEKDGSIGTEKKEDGQLLLLTSTPKPPSRPRKGDPNASILNACNSTAVLSTSEFRFMGFVPGFQKCALADNFVLLAIAAVMTNRQGFTDLFASCEHLKEGMVTFRFFETPRRFKEPEVSPRRWDGTVPGAELPFPPATPKATFVTIDTLVPCSEVGQVGHHVAVGRTDHEDEFSVALLEKAYAVFVGSYARLHHGRVDRVLEHLTRGESTFLRWTREEGNRLSSQGMAQLQWYLQEATLLRLPMVATDSLHCHSLEGTASHDVPTLTDPLRNELFAQHDDTSGADFDWGTGSVVHFSLNYHQPSEAVLAMDGNRSPVPGGINRTPKSSNTSRHQASNPQRSDIAKTWHLVKTQTLYDEEEEPYEMDFDEASAEPRPFSEQSPHWTKHARKTLNHYSVDAKLKWETVEDFATSHDCLVIMRNTVTSPDALIHFSAIPHSLRSHNAALHLPHFLLSVAKIDDGLGGLDAASAAMINTAFTDINTELVPPEMDLGEDESDDEVDDAMAQSTSSRDSSANDRLLPSVSQALHVQFRVSFPSSSISVGDDDSFIPMGGRRTSEGMTRGYPKPSYRTDNMEVMAYRVPGAKKQKCVMTEVDGRPTANLPAHSRVSVTVVATTDNEMLCEMEANTGSYNVVVVPSSSCFPLWTNEEEAAPPSAPGLGSHDRNGAELNNFVYSITAIKRQNGDSYNVGFCPL